MNAPSGASAPRRRRGGPGPFIVLALLLVVPAIVLFATHRWADAQITDDRTSARTSGGRGAAHRHSRRRCSRCDDCRPWCRGSWRSTTSAPRSTSFLPMIGDRSCVAVSVDGEPVGSRNADLPVIPASTQKLLVAATALEVLGETYQFTTSATTASAPAGRRRGGRPLPRGGRRSGAVVRLVPGVEPRALPGHVADPPRGARRRAGRGRDHLGERQRGGRCQSLRRRILRTELGRRCRRSRGRSVRLADGQRLASAQRSVEGERSGGGCGARIHPHVERTGDHGRRHRHDGHIARRRDRDRLDPVRADVRHRRRDARQQRQQHRRDAGEGVGLPASPQSAGARPGWPSSRTRSPVGRSTPPRSCSPTARD